MSLEGTLPFTILEAVDSLISGMRFDLSGKRRKRRGMIGLRCVAIVVVFHGRRNRSHLRYSNY